MSCSHCSGLTVEDHFLDFEGSYGQMWAARWHCVNCGRVHDSSIELNRLVQQERGWPFQLVSRTIRMTKSILEQSP